MPRRTRTIDDSRMTSRLHTVLSSVRCGESHRIARSKKHGAAPCFLLQSTARVGARAAPVHPRELKADAATLTDEKAQLEARVARLKKQTADRPDFDALLASTSALRVQQDEDARLREHAARQRVALQAAEARQCDKQRRLDDLRSAAGANADPRRLLEKLEHDVDRLGRRVEVELPAELDARRTAARHAASQRRHPPKTADDVAELRMAVDADEHRVVCARATHPVD